jgi:hypothetical protein
MGEVENEGISTKKKVVAGAALGVAVPAAAAVAKKFLGDDGDEGGSSGKSRSASSSGRSQSSGSRSRGGSSTSSRARSSTRTRSSSSGSRSRSSSSRSGSASSRRRTTSTTSSGPTKEQLYNQAKRLKIEGRSKMTKQQLQRAVSRARS